MGRRTDSLTRMEWPNGARCAVTLSFDVDAESSVLIRGEQFAHRLTSLSHGRYGIRRGLPRILDLLDEHGIPATFFVPGYTAEQHAEDLREVLRSGHEIGHHGYMHERPDTLSPDQERTVMHRGLEAIEQTLGVRTVSYRSPAWEITPTTLELLNAYGYAVAETMHDCGELGGLAQSRKRFLLVARNVAKVPPFLYVPPTRPLRAEHAGKPPVRTGSRSDTCRR